MKYIVIILFIVLSFSSIYTKCGLYGDSARTCFDFEMYYQCSYGQTQLNNYIFRLNSDKSVDDYDYIDISKYNVHCDKDIECRAPKRRWDALYCENQNVYDRCETLQEYLDELAIDDNPNYIKPVINCESSTTYKEGIEIYLYSGNEEEDQLISNGSMLKSFGSILMVIFLITLFI